jgi:hypothetical protein
MKCSIIQDLFAAYLSGNGSGDSRELVDEHIRSCENCKTKLEEMQRRIAANLRESNAPQVNVFKTLKRKILRRKVITAVVASVLSAALIIGTGGYVLLHDTAIAYEDGLVRVEKHYADTIMDGEGALVIVTDGGKPEYTITQKEVLDITSPKKTFGRYFTSKVVERNGESVLVVYACFSETISTRWAALVKESSFTRIVEPNEGGFGRAEVYYVDDLDVYREITEARNDKDFDDWRGGAVLVWSGSME